MSKRLRNTLKVAQHAAADVGAFSVDNVVEASGGVESGTFAVTRQTVPNGRARQFFAALATKRHSGRHSGR